MVSVKKAMMVSVLQAPFASNPLDEEFEGLYQLALAEMLSNDFCVVWYYLSAWGEKPGSRAPSLGER